LLWQWRRTWVPFVRLSIYVLLAGLVTAGWYFALKVTGLGAYWPLWLGFVCTGTLLASLQFVKEAGSQKTTLARILVLGFVQGLALLPGLSRLATVFVTARWLGLPVRRAIRLTFAIQFPLLVAAGLRGLMVYYKCGQPYVLNIWVLLGMLLAMVSAYWVLICVIAMAHTRVLRWFAWYMIVPTVFTVLLGL
jgi:undecaprenyl-diphosphatase